MRHYATNQGDHYAVSENSDLAGVLVQIQEAGEQARIMLNPEQARHMGALLIASADKLLALGAATEIAPLFTSQGAEAARHESTRETFDRLSEFMTDLRYFNQGGSIRKKSL